MSQNLPEEVLAHIEYLYVVYWDEEHHKEKNLSFPIDILNPSKKNTTSRSENSGSGLFCELLISSLGVYAVRNLSAWFF